MDGLLLALVKDFAGGFADEVVDRIVNEEHVVRVEQFQLVLVRREFLVDLRVAQCSRDSWDFEILDLVLVSALRVFGEDAEFAAEFRTVDGSWEGTEGGGEGEKD